MDNLVFRKIVMSTIFVFSGISAVAHAEGLTATGVKPVTTPSIDTTPFFSMNVMFTSETWYNGGGIKSGFVEMYGVDTNIGIDLQKLLNIPDAQLYAEGFWVRGTSLEDKFTGALAAPSAVDSFSSMNQVKLYQLYYQQRIGTTDILLGKYDTQTQFASTQPMNLFGNKAQASSQPLIGVGYGAGFNGGSVYPNTAVGLRLSQQIAKDWTVKLGVLDGLADQANAQQTTGVEISRKNGALLISELDYIPAKHTKVMAGVWGMTGQFNELGRFNALGQPLQSWGAVGAYLGGTTRVYSIGKGGIDVFANLGDGPEYKTLASKAADVGITFTGLVPARPLDRFGFAPFIAQPSQGVQNVERMLGAPIQKYEYGAEFTYRAKLTDWLVVQPQLDYIRNPALTPFFSFRPQARSVFDAGLHIEATKSF